MRATIDIEIRNAPNQVAARNFLLLQILQIVIGEFRSKVSKTQYVHLFPQFAESGFDWRCGKGQHAVHLHHAAIDQRCLFIRMAQREAQQPVPR